jgi:hypothetical protein
MSFVRTSVCAVRRLKRAARSGAREREIASERDGAMRAERAAHGRARACAPRCYSQNVQECDARTNRCGSVARRWRSVREVARQRETGWDLGSSLESRRLSRRFSLISCAPSSVHPFIRIIYFQAQTASLGVGARTSSGSATLDALSRRAARHGDGAHRPRRWISKRRRLSRVRSSARRMTMSFSLPLRAPSRRPRLSRRKPPRCAPRRP